MKGSDSSVQAPDMMFVLDFFCSQRTRWTSSTPPFDRDTTNRFPFGPNIRTDTKVPSDQKALARSDVELIRVVHHRVFKPWIIHSDLFTIAGNLKMEKVTLVW